MASGSMGVMHSKFANDAAAYSYLIFVLLYVPCVSVMGAIARESSRGWMLFSIGWGLNLAYSLATLFYQLATFTDHPQSSSMIVLAVLGFNLLLWWKLKRTTLPPERLEVRVITGKACTGCTKSESCH